MPCYRSCPRLPPPGMRATRPRISRGYRVVNPRSAPVRTLVRTLTQANRLNGLAVCRRSVSRSSTFQAVCLWRFFKLVHCHINVAWAVWSRGHCHDNQV
jgi:hypothetical protein